MLSRKCRWHTTRLTISVTTVRWGLEKAHLHLKQLSLTSTMRWEFRWRVTCANNWTMPWASQTFRHTRTQLRSLTNSRVKTWSFSPISSHLTMMVIWWPLINLLKPPFSFICSTHVKRETSTKQLCLWLKRKNRSTPTSSPASSPTVLSSRSLEWWWSTTQQPSASARSTRRTPNFSSTSLWWTSSAAQAATRRSSSSALSTSSRRRWSSTTAAGEHMVILLLLWTLIISQNYKQTKTACGKCMLHSSSL